MYQETQTRLRSRETQIKKESQRERGVFDNIGSQSLYDPLDVIDT